MSLFFYESQTLGLVGHRSSVLPPAKAVWRQSYLCFCLPWTCCVPETQMWASPTPTAQPTRVLWASEPFRAKLVRPQEWLATFSGKGDRGSQTRPCPQSTQGPAPFLLPAAQCPLGRDNLSGPQLPPLPKRDPPSIPRVHWALSPADVCDNLGSLTRHARPLLSQRQWTCEKINIAPITIHLDLIS